MNDEQAIQELVEERDSWKTILALLEQQLAALDAKIKEIKDAN